MGQATVYCEKCGDMIPEHDFAKGKAVHHEGKNYCNNCRGEVAHLLPKEAPGSGSGVTKSGSGVFKSTASPYPSVRRVSGVFQPQAVGKASVSGSQKRTSSGIRKAISAQVLKPVTPAGGEKTVEGDGRVPHSRPDTSTRSRKKSQGLDPKILIAIVGGVILIGIVAVMMIQSSKKSAEERKARERTEKAKVAVEEVREMLKSELSGTNNFDLVLDAAKSRQDLVKGEKPWQSDLESIVAAAKKHKEEFEQQKARESKLTALIAEGEKDLLEFKEGVAKLAAYLKEVADAPSAFTDKVKAAIATLREKGIRANLAEARKQAQEPKPKYQAIIDALGKLREQAEDLPGLMKEIDAEIQKIKSSIDDGAAAAFKKLSDEVYSLLDDKKFDQALRAIDDFPEEYHESKQYPELLRLRTQVIKRKEEAARGNGGGGGGGPVGPGAGAGDEVSLFNGEDLKGWNITNSSNGSWVVDMNSKSLIGENTQVGATSNEKLFWIFKGERNWADVDFTFEVKTHKGDSFFVAAHVGASGSDLIRFTQPTSQPWTKITIEYRDAVARIRLPNGQTNNVDFQNRGSTAGFMGFGLEPSTSAEFRNVSVKVITVK